MLSGQTLVLAGFISRELSSNISKVPGLGDIPVLGELFRSERFQRQETELAIFVTPVVVDADNPHLADRVRRSDTVMRTAFPDDPHLNTRVQPFPPLPSSRPSDPTQQWQPHEGIGSQWQTTAAGQFQGDADD